MTSYLKERRNAQEKKKKTTTQNRNTKHLLLKGKNLSFKNIQTGINDISNSLPYFVGEISSREDQQEGFQATV